MFNSLREGPEAGIASDLKSAETAARDALAFVGVDPDRDAEPQLAGELTESERTDIVSSCRELLLVLRTLLASRRRG